MPAREVFSTPQTAGPSRRATTDRSRCCQTGPAFGKSKRRLEAPTSRKSLEPLLEITAIPPKTARGNVSRILAWLQAVLVACPPACIAGAGTLTSNPQPTFHRRYASPEGTSVPRRGCIFPASRIRAATNSRDRDAARFGLLVSRDFRPIPCHAAGCFLDAVAAQKGC